MPTKVAEISYDLEIRAGEPLRLPDEVATILEPGVWRVSFRPLTSQPESAPRDHSAFLNSYSPEDEGLYDDYSVG